jgi:hypothetical protein
MVLATELGLKELWADRITQRRWFMIGAGDARRLFAEIRSSNSSRISPTVEGLFDESSRSNMSFHNKQHKWEQAN